MREDGLRLSPSGTNLQSTRKSHASGGTSTQPISFTNARALREVPFRDVGPGRKITTLHTPVSDAATCACAQQVVTGLGESEKECQRNAPAQTNTPGLVALGPRSCFLVEFHAMHTRSVLYYVPLLSSCAPSRTQKPSAQASQPLVFLPLYKAPYSRSSLGPHPTARR